MAKQKRKKAGLPPGTLIYTGRKESAGANVMLLQYNGEILREQYARDKLPEWEEGEFVSWYDVRGLTNIELVDELGRRFNIHPLVLEDVLNTNQRPKLEEYANGLFLILNAMSWNAGELSVQVEQVAVFSGAGLVISFQEDEDDLFPPVRERLQTARGKIRQRGAGYLTYALADYIIDNYYIVLDRMEEAIEGLEQEILLSPKADTKNRLHKLKLAILRLRKACGPTREAIGRLYRLEHPLIGEETAVFIRDLHDHISQITDSIETYRDMINGLHDLYLSEISLRMNSVIQILTIISTIFIPLTFLVGVYGMNFRYMPELEGRYSYFILWGVMALVFLGQLLFFRRRRWL